MSGAMQSTIHLADTSAYCEISMVPFRASNWGPSHFTIDPLQTVENRRR
jgi:hypothetical protein